jgi:CRP/FNR family transcriptional regulator
MPAPKSPLVFTALQSSVLSGLPKELSDLLFGAAKPHRVKTGEALFSAGDPGDGCYRLEEGLLKVVMNSPRGEARIVSILSPRAIVGELSMIDGLPRSATVMAMRDSALQFLSRKAFQQCTAAHPEISGYLMVTLTMRLREADDALAAMTFMSVKARVARALVELAKHIGQDSDAGRITLSHKISQGDLAAMAGVARENVSRTLSEWRQRKLVTQSSAYYCINDMDGLARETELDV